MLRGSRAHAVVSAVGAQRQHVCRYLASLSGAVAASMSIYWPAGHHPEADREDLAESKSKKEIPFQTFPLPLNCIIKRT